MTFEEFFKKKKIDLDALQKAEPGLFSEFKTHFEQMGEKSFDHTKKYWFNRIRREYPLDVEPKTGKVRLPNPLAEQTITESLNEQITAPKPVFVPKFKANIAKPEVVPADEAADLPEPTAEPGTTENAPAASPENTEVKPAYKPRFSVNNLPKKEE